MKYKTRSIPKKVKRRQQREMQKYISINLPEEYPWKVCSKLLLDLKDCLPEADFNDAEQILRNRDFAGYLKLAEAWGLQSMASTGTNLGEIRAKYAIASLIKKFQFPSDKDIRVCRATEIFSDAESACKSYNNLRYMELIRPETDWGVEILHYAKVFLKRLLGAELPGHLALLNRSRHGPGATLGTKNGHISAYHKFAEWPYSCTSGAFRYARFAIETDPRWFGALQNSYRSRLKIPKHYPLDMKRFWTEVIKVVDGNRICFVPKDAQKERTIAIEPTLNLYLQLGVDGFIRKRLKRFGTNLDSQEKNQRLAFLGSLRDDEDSFVTIDLSAASDSISLKLCEILLPSQWYSYLMDLRSPLGVLGEEKISYEKISSMGNGYTFALESAIFAALVYAVTKAGGAAFDHTKYAVFGDDIIVQKRWYYRLVEALRLSGFKVNLEKTFFSGPIRESCGTDWFQGKPLRPVFLTQKPSNVLELFCDFNRLKRLLSLRWAIDDESNCLSQLLKWIPDKARCLTGPFSDEDFDSYIHSAFPRKGMYKRCMYEYDRLIVLPIPQVGDSFLFRKLMHDLRGKSPTPPLWWKPIWGLKECGSGSRFTVTSRKALSVGKTSSVSDIWRSEYDERIPR